MRSLLRGISQVSSSTSDRSEPQTTAASHTRSDNNGSSNRSVEGGSGGTSGGRHGRGSVEWGRLARVGRVESGGNSNRAGLGDSHGREAGGGLKGLKKLQSASKRVGTTLVLNKTIQ